MIGRPGSYPVVASPSINIQEFPNSTPSTLPTQNPFPSPLPSASFRHSPIAFTDHNGLLMVQTMGYGPSMQHLNSPILLDQQQHVPTAPPEAIPEQTEGSGTALLPTVLPGMSEKDPLTSQV
jgi:hypothetical protein